MTKKNIAVSVKGLHKSFKLPHEQHSGIKQVLINTLQLKGSSGYENQHVLKGLDFEIEDGDFFGIVGRNGSGKSTLLKLLAGIYTPDEGSVQINGSLTPFIELGVGFNPELTGRENVYMNGALLGFDRKQMDGMYDSIVEFAELEDFMDQKLKNYSSGMQVRLAFSIAIRADSDILLLDEVLAVGDENFQRKCNQYFTDLKKNKKTVILVTHSMDDVRKYCDKALLIEKGEVLVNGSPEDVANQYTLSNFDTKKERTSIDKHKLGLSDLVPVMEIEPVSKRILSSKDEIVFNVNYEIIEDMPVKLGISVIDERSGGATSIFDDSIKDKNSQSMPASMKKGRYSFRYKIPLKRFNNRDFMITAVLRDARSDLPINIAYTAEDRVGRFAIRGEKHDGGLLKEKGEWV